MERWNITDDTVGDAYMGMIHYLIEWFAGEEYTMKEIECRALGDPVNVFEIWKG
jgi:predicted hydrocarbon binding protein